MPDGSTQALTLPPGMDPNDPRVGSIVDEYLSASPGAPQPQPQPQATLSGPSVWDAYKQLANRVTDTIPGTTRNAQGEIISTQPTVDTTGRQFSEELDIARGMSPEQTAANMRKRSNDGLDTARFVGETLVPQNLADAASIAALIATAPIAGIAGVAIRAAAAPIADMVTRAAAGQPRDLTTALIKGVGSLVGDAMGRVVQYLGFVAQPGVVFLRPFITACIVRCHFLAPKISRLLPGSQLMHRDGVRFVASDLMLQDILDHVTGMIE
jgi:hypothetical protein